jgi:two-component sensor histidine kinase
VQHRVKNNMQVVSSLLRMQAQYVKNEDDARLFQESQDRIYSMSMVYDQLCHSEDVAQIKLREYVKELTANLIHSYSPSNGYVSPRIDVDDICVGLDVAIPCGLLINELVTNSMKYAFPYRTGGNISISLYEKGGVIDLTVADDGVGLPANLDVPKGDTLGMTLLHTLSEQLGGKMEFRPGNGTVFHISFNLAQPA